MTIATAQNRATLRSGSAAEAGMDPDRVARIRERGAEWVRDGVTPSLVLLAARRGVVFLHEPFGTLAQNGAPVQRDTLFPIASMTKSMTATAIMMLVEEGKVGLGRSVQDYIPEFQGKGKEDVLLWHLLTHTSGLRWEDVEFYATTTGATVQTPPPEPTEFKPTSRFLHQRYGAPLWKRPGEEMSYCTFNYVVLGEIVRRGSGIHGADFMDQRIFAPLGMADTTAHYPGDDSPRLATLPADAPLRVLFPSPALPPGLPARGDAGVVSTALDLAVFGQACLNGGRYGDVRLLSPATIQQMTRNQIPGISVNWFGQFHREASWGYGWQVTCDEKWSYFDGSLRPAESFGHGGATGTFYWIDPQNEVVGVYLSLGVAWERDVFRHRFDLFQNMVYAALDG